jgi:NADH dehydrogenase [ubiquinone] 1 alpha subcomplex assembly factor 1
MRMEISPTSKNQGALLIYAMTQPAHLSNFATGSDSDIGGLSQCRLGLDESSRGRFYGTLSSQVPRGGKIEKSGYAGFRNRNRPTLFGNQCWDTTVHPYLALRVRNRLAKKPIAGADKSEHADAGAGSGLRAALHASGPSGPATSRAVHALGLGRKELPGPKFFVNIQTDGPVTSDLFQHRLYLDESKGSNWQTVIVSCGLRFHTSSFPNADVLPLTPIVHLGRPDRSRSTTLCSPTRARCPTRRCR